MKIAAKTKAGKGNKNKFQQTSTNLTHTTAFARESIIDFHNFFFILVFCEREKNPIERAKKIFIFMKSKVSY
jgi:hypothetical protein